MDLVSHDILNSNQAVLSYLELILSSASADERTKKYAAKASSQLRTSSMLIESLKGVMTVQKWGEIPMEEIALASVLERSARKLERLFPDRGLEIDSTGVDSGAAALGREDLLQDLFDNLLMNSVQLDQEDVVSMRLRTAHQAGEEGDRWRIMVEMPGGTLPEQVTKDVSALLELRDISRTVRVSGLLFASLIAEALGGKLETGAPDDGEGCSFSVSLRGVDRR